MTTKPTVIEVQKGTWLYMHAIIGWKEESDKCLTIYTSNGNFKFEYPDVEKMTNVSEKLRSLSRVNPVSYDE